MALEDVYDDPTLWAIDREQPRRSVGSVGGWRGAMVAGALHAAISGVREVLDPPALTPQIVEVSPDPLPRPDARVRLLFVPHAPQATRAFVRW
ncbi:MAG TPA: hypothetical protein VM282_04160 [Acidimicrobiales bacterium]|nr:hypothetical protein [Acidimicrobiales bacterium]